MMTTESNPITLSIVIPVYNEQDTIGEVIEQVSNVDLGSVAKEIIISDDGSTDDSPQIIQKYGLDRPDMIKVHTSRINLGKGAAVRLGMSYATGDIVIIQDADLELDPNEYAIIIEPIVAGEADVVYGSRFLQKSQIKVPRLTRLANRVLTLITNILYGARLTDMATAYKAFKREVVDGMRFRCARFDFDPEITAKFLRAGYRIHEVPITYNPRTVDEGKKISWLDGIEHVYALFRCRFWDQ